MYHIPGKEVAYSLPIIWGLGLQGLFKIAYSAWGHHDLLGRLLGYAWGLVLQLLFEWHSEPGQVIEAIYHGLHTLGLTQTGATSSLDIVFLLLPVLIYYMHIREGTVSLRGKRPGGLRGRSCPNSSLLAFLV